MTTAEALELARETLSKYDGISPRLSGIEATLARALIDLAAKCERYECGRS
jgi:hypothetical protein